MTAVAPELALDFQPAGVAGAKAEEETFGKVWPTYGNTVILPGPNFGRYMEYMCYSINPFMNTGSVSDEVSSQFGEELANLHDTLKAKLLDCSLKNRPNLLAINPITPDFPLRFLLAGVRDHLLSDREKRILEQTICETCGASDSDFVLKASTVRENSSAMMEALRDRLPAEKASECVKVLESMGSAIPDAVYLANGGLYLGRSPLLDNKPVFIVQSPRMAERQLENAFGRVLATELGFYPVEMARAFEGMADLICVHSRSHKKRVLLGFDSSRSDAGVYSEVLKIAKAFQIADFPDELVIVEAKDKDHCYHQDLAILTLPTGKACVGEDVFTDKSLDTLRGVFAGLYMIPASEWMAFSMNSILVDERLGCDPGFRFAIIPPNCPTLHAALTAEGYEVQPQALAYTHGGGFLRCLTLFADVDFGSADKLLKPVDVDDYRSCTAKLAALPADIKTVLHWSPQVHSYTEELLSYYVQRATTCPGSKPAALIDEDLHGNKVVRKDFLAMEGVKRQRVSGG
jgi:N-dimethylarginine dimethylaminohydrolase